MVHVRTERSTAAKVDQMADSGEFLGEDTDTFWIKDEKLGVLGCVRIEDLSDDTPMFDLRMATEFRGRGLGVASLCAVTDHVFATLNVDRFEGCTRSDNIAMRSTFIRAGWSKEAHYRRAWVVQGEAPKDAVAILREEWALGISVEVPWYDLPPVPPKSRND